MELRSGNAHRVCHITCTNLQEILTKHYVYMVVLPNLTCSNIVLNIVVKEIFHVQSCQYTVCRITRNIPGTAY
jgi:uncharacterized membrane protein